MTLLDRHLIFYYCFIVLGALCTEHVLGAKEHVSVQFSSVAQSCSTLCYPLDCSHARLPCLSPTPKACSNSCPLNWWCHLTISFSVIPFSSCLQSFQASGSFPMSQFFASCGQNIDQRSDRQSAWRTIDRGLWHYAGGSDQDHPQEKEIKNMFGDSLTHWTLWAGCRSYATTIVSLLWGMSCASVIWFCC